MTIPKWLKRSIDFSVTIILWMYFTLGYFILFSPFYIFSFLFSINRETSFQKLNHRFFKSFFWVLRIITPRLTIHIDEDVYSIRSSVIVCNHISYLDPILLISLFDQQKTIIKKTFLKVPVFGWLLKTSGYLFTSTEETFATFLLDGVENLKNYLVSGENIFIFPEGTRSRDGKIGRLNKGAFSLAKRCRAPIEVLMIKNTNTLFAPGKWLFNTCAPNTIEVKRILSLQPEYASGTFSIQSLIEQVRQAFEQQRET
ncbi:MAG: 1-acyl-sn-glycerol-3-phosphate acyltransferase [Deltaproteobacteria bacterium]|nr:1-acyl-sn-glycerol-3-phosphate acyltransferase [Deltaproteobacteria bacterium]